MDWRLRVIVLLLSVASLCLAAPVGLESEDEDMDTLQELKRTTDIEALEALGPPPRPAKFKNKMELQNYLDSLREYYSVIGRPR